MRGVQRAARGTDARLFIGAAPHASWDDDIEAEARFIRELGEDGADGAILWYLGGDRNLPALREARARGVEFVFVDRRPPKGFEADFVGTENVGAARAATATSSSSATGASPSSATSTPPPPSPTGARATAAPWRTRAWSPLELAFAPLDGEPDGSAARRVALELKGARRSSR